MSLDLGFKPKFRGIFNRDPEARILEKVVQWHHEQKDGIYNSDDDEASKPEAESSEQAKQRKSTSGGGSDCRTYPGSDKGDVKNRFIFRHWPRDPHGPYADLLPGKTIGNGLKTWGATLLDFYRMRTIPQTALIEKLSSGSRMAAWCRANNELEWAKEELEWEENEASPQEQHPVDMADLIRDDDFFRTKGFLPTKSLSRQEDHSDAEPTLKDQMDPFHISNYPKPWPLVPFSSQPPAFPLQKRLPYYLLPQQLIVHDPWNLLHASNPLRGEDPDEIMEDDWEEKPDIIKVYNLSLSKENQQDLNSQRRQALNKWEEKKRRAASGVEKLLIAEPPKEGPAAVPILLPSPPPLRPVLEVPKAHMYVSPTGKLGEGNHSLVYKVELELPRYLFFDPVLCSECIHEIADKALEARKAADPDYRPLVGNVTKEGDAMVDPGVDVEFIHESELKNLKGREDIPDHNPQVPLKGKGKADPVDPVSKLPREAKRTHELHPPVYSSKFSYSHSAHILTQEEVVDLKYQDKYRSGRVEKLCSHLQAEPPTPLTITVCVAAKLSLQHDDHLENEARNYMRFPEHMFKHWTGFNLTPPLHDPVPVGALVPQFYGYYKPETPGKGKKYLSPILLLENCGEQVNVDALGIDDRQECFSLFLRLHAAGWLHQSVYARNVLVQKGSLFDFPTFKKPEDRRFRLIDFGRSKEMESAKHCTMRVTGDCQCRKGTHSNTETSEKWRLDKDADEEMNERLMAQRLFRLVNW